MHQVIIVDDEENVREILSRMLATMEMTAESDVIPFARSDYAWEYILQLPPAKEPDIVFSSVDIDGAGKMNGFDLLAKIREKFPDVIFVSMSGDPGYEEKARERGADHFLAKPFSEADLGKIFA